VATSAIPRTPTFACAAISVASARARCGHCVHERREARASAWFSTSIRQVSNAALAAEKTRRIAVTQVPAGPPRSQEPPPHSSDAAANNRARTQPEKRRAARRLRLKTVHRWNRGLDATIIRNASPTEMFIRMEGRNGGAPCLACPIIQIVIFRPVKAKTMLSLTSPRTYSHLLFWDMANSSMIAGSDSALAK
jgi:phytoene dehydrogenase-like protein